MRELGRKAAQSLDSRGEILAADIVERQYLRHPELVLRYGPEGRTQSLKDARYHLSYLAEAVAYGSQSLFSDYVVWEKSMLGSRGIPPRDLLDNLEFLKEAINAQLGEGDAFLIRPYVDAAIRRISDPAVDAFIPHANLGDLARSYIAALLEGKRHIASRLVLEAAEQGTSVHDIYLNIFEPAQHEIGRLWQLNRITVAQEHYCTAATQLIMSQLYPRLFEREKTKGNIVAACVGGDLHEIGVRMVADFFELDGWNTYYLGASTPAPAVVQTIAEQRADLVAISATMTFHTRAAAELIAAIRSDPSTRDVGILVGGYPFNRAPDLWRQVGADATAPNARQAIEIAHQLRKAG